MVLKEAINNKWEHMFKTRVKFIPRGKNSLQFYRIILNSIRIKESILAYLHIQTLWPSTLEFSKPKTS